jgi:hypothetical protein
VWVGGVAAYPPTAAAKADVLHFSFAPLVVHRGQPRCTFHDQLSVQFARATCQWFYTKGGNDFWDTGMILTISELVIYFVDPIAQSAAIPPLPVIYN